MKILTSGQMREIDRRAIEEVGIPGPVLMENAGLRIFDVLRERFPRLRDERIVVVAGKGNNGGDGFVVARHLHNAGATPLVVVLAKLQELKGDAALNARIAKTTGIAIIETPSAGDWSKARAEIRTATLIVDAIFGTGLTKPAEGFSAKIIEDINGSRGFKVSVDIPSGLSSDTFLVTGPSVKADLTIALAAPKIAHVFPPAADFVGELRIVDIGIPRFLFRDPELKLDMVEPEEVRAHFRPRKKDSHKGTYGHLLCVAGSWGKTGAAAMAGRAALRLGAGLVTVATPQSCLPLVARTMPELMTEPLPETEARTISDKAVGRVLSLLKDKDGLLIGPGLSTHKSTAAFFRALLPRVKVPVVIDADGLNLISEQPGMLKTLRPGAVLTPHPGEFARMLGRSIKEVLEKRLALVPEFAVRYGVHLVLKGYRTLTASPSGRVLVNPTGNPGMATAGSGDVLSGMIASLLVQEKDALAAASSAVYLHGLCGDLAAAKLGQKYLSAGDLIPFIPTAIKALGA